MVSLYAIGLSTHDCVRDVYERGEGGSIVRAEEGFRMHSRVISTDPGE